MSLSNTESLFEKKAGLLARLFCISVVSLAPGLAGEEWKLYTFREPHMGTEFTIRSWAQQGQVDDLTLLSEQAFDRVEDLNNLLSDYWPETELSLLAKAPSGSPIPVGEELFEIFTAAGNLYTKTEGAFDITAGPLIRLWRVSRKNRRAPQPDRILFALARTGFDHLTLDPEARTITKRVDGMLFDLGGIAKGYAADEMLRIMREGGFPRTLVAASGDIVVGAPPPGETGWRVGLETLTVDGPAHDLDTVVLVNEAVSTSGDTRQYLELDGVRYSHIVSTRTGLGLTERIGASVIAPDAMTSDSYATAVTLLGEKDGLQFIENQRGIECRIVALRDGREVEIPSDGFAEYQQTQVEEKSPVTAP